MTKRTIFECDGCGDRFGAKNDVVPAEVRHESDEWFQHTDETLYLCFDGCGGDALVTVNNSRYRRFLIDANRNVVGVMTGLQVVLDWEDVVAGLDDDAEDFEAAKEAVEAAL